MDIGGTNTVFGIVDSRGNVLATDSVKTQSFSIFTALFVYGLQCGISMISTATILSQLFLLAAAVRNMNQKDNVFGFSMRAVSFQRDTTVPMISLSIPVIAEKIIPLYFM